MNSLSISPLLALLMLLPASAFPQEAQDILAKVAANYQAMKNFHFEGSTTSETKAKGVDTTSETHFVVAYTEPDKFRVELRYPTAGNWIRLSDGKISTTSAPPPRTARRKTTTLPISVSSKALPSARSNLLTASTAPDSPARNPSPSTARMSIATSLKPSARARPCCPA